MIKSKKSPEKLATKIEQMARKGELGYNTKDNVRTTTLPNGDIVVTAESTSGWSDDTGVEIQISQSPNSLGSRATFNPSRKNTAASSKISEIEKTVNKKI